jgi:beta-N-acetylglucosaminidase
MRKLLKYATAFLIVLLVFVGLKVFATSPPRINIDSPVNNSYITNSVTISGWSLNTSGVKSVQVYINGNKVGNAATGIERDDVNSAFNKSGVYKNGLNSGFSLKINTSTYSPGNYTVTVLSTGNNWTTATASMTFKKAASLIHIEKPSGTANISSDFTIQGWSLNPNGVKEVDVSVDGKTPVSAQSGLSRPDVYNAFKAAGCYPGALNSGFTYAVSYKSLTLGSHSIKVTSYGNDGSSISTTFKVNIVAPAPMAAIDASATKVFMESSFTVTGWSLNSSGVKSVDVYIGTTKIGSATIGLVRDDVNSIENPYGLYKGGENSGFSFTLPNTSSYPSGTYKLTIVSTGNDNTTVKTSENVTKLPARANIETPANGSTVKGDFVFKGWAVTPGGVSSVQVLLDGKPLGAATVGLARPDVQKVLSAQNGGDGYINSASSGFSYNVDLDTVANGAHTITANVTGTGDGSTVNVTSKFTVAKPAPIAHIEMPSGNNEYLRDTLTVSGWSVDASGVKSVEVYIDGNDLGSATIGLSRADVNSAVNSENDFKGAANSGYTFTATGFDSYKAGSHTIKIVSTGNSGGIATCQTKVTKAAPMSKFDTASQNFTVNNSDFTVSGWALNATGVSEVELYYNGKLLATDTAGTSSTDVENAYDANNIIYDNSAMARYTFAVSINSVPCGTGTFTLHAIGNDGSTSDVSTSVNVVKPQPLGSIDTPASGQNLTFYNSSIVISGWALNASGVQSVSVFIDGTQIQGVQTGLASDSGILALSNGQYQGDANARFTTGNIDITGLSYAQHTIKVSAVGNDGQVYVLSEKIYKSATAYSSYAISLSTMLSKQSSAVSTGNIDPNAILSQSNAGLYEFLNLQYNSNTITAAQINSMLNVSGVSNNVLKNMGQAFIDAAKTYHINPVYLAAHARLETGNGTSTLARGQVYPTDGVTYYDVYGIGAYDVNPVSDGLAAAHKYGWNTVYKAIVGGAQFIHDHYVYAADMGHPPTQNTLYKMKWDPDDAQSGSSLFEYATDPNWAYNIAAIINANANIFNGYQLTFDIPKYQ